MGVCSLATEVSPRQPPTHEPGYSHSEGLLGVTRFLHPAFHNTGTRRTPLHVHRLTRYTAKEINWKNSFDCKSHQNHLHLAKKFDQAKRPISTTRLHVLPHFHLWPINLLVLKGSSGCSYLEAGFALICFQRLSVPNVATQRCHWRDNWYTRGLSIPVLSY